MPLAGLPDFQQPLHGEGFQVFYPFEHAGPCVVTPSFLEIARQADGRPDFSLVAVRGWNPMLPPKPHAVLDFRLVPRFRLEDALELVRAKALGATVTAASFTSSYIGLKPPVESIELERPVALGWNGLQTSRFVLQCSPESFTLMKQSLQKLTATFQAAAVVEMEGVSPRLAVTVRFTGADLATAMSGIAKAGRVSWDDATAFFSGDLSKIPMKIEGELPSPDVRTDFAEAMADLLRSKFGAAVPLSAADLKPCITLPSRSEVVEVDLSEPRVVSRGFTLSLDPFSYVQDSIAALGVDTVVHETQVPQIQTGAHRIAVTANLPPNRPGVFECGVTLRAPAVPPHRMQTITVSGVFQTPQDSADLLLRLAPAEPLRYSYSTFVVLESDSSVVRLDGPEMAHDDEQLYLSPADFPVGFVGFSASQSLLNLASIRGSIRSPDSAATSGGSFELTAELPSLAQPIPKGWKGCLVDIEAVSKEDATVLKLSRPALGSWSLDLASFDGYGSQQVDIECDFAGGPTELLALDLRPEDAADTQATVLAFTRANARRRWQYFAASPFRSGFVYRVHRSDGEAHQAWSPVQHPGITLKISPPGEAADAHA